MFVCYKQFKFESKYFEGPVWSVCSPIHGRRSQKQISNPNKPLHINRCFDCRCIAAGIWKHNLEIVGMSLHFEMKPVIFPISDIGSEQVVRNQTVTVRWRLKQITVLCLLKGLKLQWSGFGSVRECMLLVTGPGCSCWAGPQHPRDTHQEWKEVVRRWMGRISEFGFSYSINK